MPTFPRSPFLVAEADQLMLRLGTWRSVFEAVVELGPCNNAAAIAWARVEVLEEALQVACRVRAKNMASMSHSAAGTAHVLNAEGLDQDLSLLRARSMAS
mmetsp:Transcript_70205/g.184014  ORF Transcript_70205/g.184014 Transcript_70205/m.184014 type:complete len:100 (+) Transcript_70205:398-697(+)